MIDWMGWALLSVALGLMLFGWRRVEPDVPPGPMYREYRAATDDPARVAAARQAAGMVN